MIARFSAFARSLGLEPWRAVAVLGLVLVISQALALSMLSGPLLILHVFDGVLETRSSSTLVVLILMFVLVQLVAAVVRHLRQGIMQAVSAMLERKLMLLSLRVSVQLAREGQPEKASATLGDFSSLRRFLGGSSITDMMGLLGLPLPLWFMFGLHPLLGWLSLIGCVLLVGFSVLMERQGRAGVQEAAQLGNRATSELTRHLQRNDEVVGLGLLSGIVRHWYPMRRESLRLQQFAWTRAEVLETVSSAVSLFVVCAAAALAASLVIHHEAAPATFAASFHVVSRLLGPCENAAQHWTRWSLALASFRRMQQARALMQDRQGRLPAEADGVLRIDGLRLEVPGTGRVLVENLDMQVHPGTIVTVTGRNAAGKSTLLRAIIGLTLPTEGAVLFRGAVMHATDRSAIGPHIGFMGQRAQLLRGSIMDNISRFSNDSEAAVLAARRSGAHEMIGRLPAGYNTSAEAKAGLSGGQQRQVALARALFGDPGLLVLDEPEVGLDAPALAALVEAVAAARDRGAIVFLVTHDLRRWADVADVELRLQDRGAWQANMLRQQVLLAADR